QRYLDQTTDGAHTPDATTASGAATFQDEHEFLKKARAAAEHGAPQKMTVRELVARWDSATRSSTLDSLIENDLANHGLTTVPNFRKVGLDTSVQIQLLSNVVEASGG